MSACSYVFILFLCCHAVTQSRKETFESEEELEEINIFVEFLKTVHKVNRFSGRLSKAIYSIDDSHGTWTTFDGIGAVSGGGATSKLLVNYPEPTRSDILDYLFKPSFGASLQILKVEIGGDSQSTDGSESSHMHTPDDENYNRGYEWWVMLEAKKRNPSIKLYALPWVFPGWVGGGVFNPFINRTATVGYVFNWIDGAWREHGLKIDYIGVWNERTCDKEYVKLLRSTLDKSDYKHVEIVVPDAANWDFLRDFKNDPDYVQAISIIGQHYPGAETPTEALRYNKKVWASEEYSDTNGIEGGGCWARVLNENVVFGYYTGVIAWNLIASYYDQLPYGRNGLMTASSPWSGHYDVSTPIWVSAHHTQFYVPGWEYLIHGHGIGTLDGNGTYITLTSPDRTQLTIVIETIVPKDAPCFYDWMPRFTVADQQVASFVLSGSFSSIQKLYVWYSTFDFKSGTANMFKRMMPILVDNGQFTIKLRKNIVCTLTTVADGNHGDHGPTPGSAPFPFPYTETFEGYAIGDEPFNFAQQSGAFEVTDSGDQGHGKVMTQVVTQPPVDTCLPERMPRPVNLIGNFLWTSVDVRVDVLIKSEAHGAQGVILAAMVDTGGCWSMYSNGIYFWVFLHNSTALLTGNQPRSAIYKQVQIKAPQYDKWFTMTLSVQNPTVAASLDGQVVMNVTIERFPSTNGFIVLGPTEFGIAHWDNFHIVRASEHRSKRSENNAFRRRRWSRIVGSH